MPAGTIALTNGSATVAGSGTSFTSKLKAGDFIYVMVGGAPYTLVASTVVSNTQVTLAVAYDGPTSSGLAWVVAPALMQAAITQKMLNDLATVARGRILDFQNWQKIYSDAQSVTVTRPDRTTFTGPSWGYLAGQYDSKASKGDNSDITSLTGLTTPLSTAYGGTGASNAAGAWKNIARYGIEEGTAAQGNDLRFSSIWCTFNGGTGSIAQSMGISSIVKNDGGDWTVNFSKSMMNTSYCVLITAFTTGSAVSAYGFLNKTSTSIRIRSVLVANGTLTDVSQISLVIFGV